MLYSTLYGKTHRFRVMDFANLNLENAADIYRDGVAMSELFGTAGLPGAFYVQLRDEYGNLVQEPLSEGTFLSVDIIGSENGQLVYLGTEASPERPEINYMGFGIYAVRFFSDKAAVYTVRVEIDGIPVKQITQHPVTLVWQQTSDLYQLRIKPSVTDPNMCEAYGPGLRGARIGITTSINIVAKDELGNKRDETGATQVRYALKWCSGDASMVPVALSSGSCVATISC